MKILSSFTLPLVDPNLYECVCSAEHKGIYSEEWGKQSSIFSYYWSQWFPKTAWLQTFFRISSFVFRTNTFIPVWIYLRMSTWWQHFHFWVNYPFKIRTLLFKKCVFHSFRKLFSSCSISYLNTVSQTYLRLHLYLVLLLVTVSLFRLFTHL